MTTVSYEIPLSPQAQKFQIALAGVTYTLTLWWSTIANCWNIDIADAQGNPIVSSVAVVAGIDLLNAFAYLDFGGQLIAQTDNQLDVPPTYDNLGSTSHIYFVVTT
jgi:hypothetical protein